MSCDSSLSRRQLLAMLSAFGVSADALAASDPAKLDPLQYRIVLENERVRVLEYGSQPAGGVCGIGRHWHPPHVVVQMTPLRVRVTAEDGKLNELDVPAGAIFYEPAVTHVTENIGKGDAKAYIVELKDAAWKPATGTTRPT